MTSYYDVPASYVSFRVCSSVGNTILSFSHSLCSYFSAEWDVRNGSGNFDLWFCLLLIVSDGTAQAAASSH